MKITPLELRQYEFEKTFRGYNIEEVDMFIANLSQEWERVLNESKMLKMQLEIAEKEAAKLREIEVTLFRTLKTAEDTSTMITDQANLQAQKRISEANEKSEKLLQDANEYSQQQVIDAEAKATEIVNNANKKSTEIITSAEQQARHIQEDILEEVQSLERDFKAMQNYKANLLVQMRSLANATIEHVERFETKFDFDKIQQNITEASHLIGNAQPIIESSEPIAITEEVVTTSEIEELSAATEEIQETVADLISTDEIAIKDEVAEIATEVEIIEEEIALEIETPTITEEIETAVQEEIIETADVIEDTTIDLPLENEPVFEIEKENLTIEESPNFVEETIESVETPILEEEIEETPIIEAPVFEEEKIEETPIIEAPVFEERRTILSSSVNNFVEEVPVAEAPIFKASPATNNLELIQGITPEISQILNQAGITTFRELATTPAYKVRQYLEDAGDEFSTINPTSWTEQALLAAEERWDDLKERQIELQKSAESVQEIATENVVPVAPVSNLDNITEEMLEKVNKVKDAIRKAMIDKGEKAEMKVKDDGYLPTIDDVVNKVKKKSGSFFDNID